MSITRRSFGYLALSAVPLLARPNSRFKGVQIGAITYSFRALPSTAADIVKYCTELGINSVELMSDVAEVYAGAPAVPRVPGRNATAEQRQAAQHGIEERTKWRTSASMGKYRQLRAMFNAAGIRIPVFKLAVEARMSDAECDYIFETAKALGAHCVTMELPKDPALSKRAGEFGARHRVYVGYHSHTQVNEQSWDTALSQSPYNSINLDVGHFTEAISKSPVPFIERNSARITSFHLKDKKFGTNGGGNRPWGQGDTPLEAVLQLMAKRKYRWPANIELEYDVPKDSSVIAEMKKCVSFCRSAIGKA